MCPNVFYHMALMRLLPIYDAPMSQTVWRWSDFSAMLSSAKVENLTCPLSPPCLRRCNGSHFVLLTFVLAIP